MATLADYGFIPDAAAEDPKATPPEAPAATAAPKSLADYGFQSDQDYAKTLADDKSKPNLFEYAAQNFNDPDTRKAAFDAWKIRQAKPLTRSDVLNGTKAALKQFPFAPIVEGAARGDLSSLKDPKAYAGPAISTMAKGAGDIAGNTATVLGDTLPKLVKDGVTYRRNPDGTTTPIATPIEPESAASKRAYDENLATLQTAGLEMAEHGSAINRALGTAKNKILSGVASLVLPGSLASTAANLIEKQGEKTPQPTAQDDEDYFNTRVALAKERMDASTGNTQATMGGLIEKGESPESLSAQGAPVDPATINRQAGLIAPENVIPVGTPSAITEKIAGKGLEWAGKGAEIPANLAIALAKKGKAAKIALGVTGAAGAVGAGYEIAHHPEAAALGAGALISGLAGKGIGRIIREAGEQGVSPNFVAPESRAATEALVKNDWKKPLAQGDLGTAATNFVKGAVNPAMNIAAAKQGARSAISGAANAAVAMAPYNAAISETPEEFGANEGSAVGLGAFAGLAHAAGSQGQYYEKNLANALHNEGSQASYGTGYDDAHTAAMATMSKGDQNVVNKYRGFFGRLRTEDGTPIQIYALKSADYQKALEKNGKYGVGEDSNGFVSGDGSQVFLNAENGSSPGDTAGHEGTHVMETLAGHLAPQLMDGLKAEMASKLYDENGTPTPEFSKFMDGYNQALGVKAITPEQKANAESEFMAETGRAILSGGNIEKFALPKPIMDSVKEGAQKFLEERLGIQPKPGSLGFDGQQIAAVNRGMMGVLFGVGENIHGDAKQEGANFKLDQLNAQIERGTPKDATPDQLAEFNAAVAARDKLQKAISDAASAQGRSNGSPQSATRPEAQPPPVPTPNPHADIGLTQEHVDAARDHYIATDPQLRRLSGLANGAKSRLAADPENPVLKASATRASNAADRRADVSGREWDAMFGNYGEALRDSGRTANPDTLHADVLAHGAGADISKVSQAGESEEATPPPIPTPNAQPPTPGKVSVPMMITRRMEQQLRDRGYTQSQIDKMTPADAHAALSAEPEPSTESQGEPPSQQPKPISEVTPEDVKPQTQAEQAKTGGRTGVQDAPLAGVSDVAPLRGDRGIPESDAGAEAINHYPEGSPERAAVSNLAGENRGFLRWIRGYLSPEAQGEGGQRITEEQRKKDLNASPAKNRTAGTLQDIPVIPVAWKLPKNPDPTTGTRKPFLLVFRPDVWTNNIEQVHNAAKKAGLDPWEGLTGTKLDAAIQDAMEKYVRNHNRGTSGTGKGLSTPGPDFFFKGSGKDAGGEKLHENPSKAQQISDILNMALASKKNLGTEAFNLENQGFNRNGEFNKLRDALGKIKLSNPFNENIAPDMIQGEVTKDAPENIRSVRPSALTLDYGKIFEHGRPSSEASAAGFMPNSEKSGPLSDVDPKAQTEDEYGGKYGDLDQYKTDGKWDLAKSIKTPHFQQEIEKHKNLPLDYFNIKGKSWIWDSSNRLIKTQDGGTHADNFGDSAEKQFRGWYDKDQNKVSVAFPPHALRAIPGDKPTVDDIPQGVYDAIKRKFPKDASIVAFMPKGEKGPLSDVNPKEEGGFYSHLSRVIDQKVKGRVSAEQLEATLRNNGVKKDELDWTLGDLLSKKKGQSITPQEIRDALAENQVQVKEVVKGGAGNGAANQLSDAELKSFLENSDIDVAGMGRREMEEAATELADQDYGASDGTKFSQYQLPGGENYREVLLTLPSPEDSLANQKMEAIAKRLENPDLTEDQKRDLRIQYRDLSPVSRGSKAFQSSHFDEPNILAHLRVNDRKTADGKSMLFLEELQSDWHQKGRKEGYSKGSPIESINQLTRDQCLSIIRRNEHGNDTLEGDETVEELRDTVRYYLDQEGENEGGPTFRYLKSLSEVPDAPFKGEGWKRLGLKKAIEMAVKEGKDSIGWTTGEQQADRYDLSKHVDSVWAKKNGDKYDIVADLKNGNPLFDTAMDGPVTAEKLETIIGKELTQKIVDQKDGSDHTYSGLELKVGGQGMRGFYDREMVNIANDIGKKFGAKVEKAKLPGRNIETPLLDEVKEYGVDEDTQDPVQALIIARAPSELIDRVERAFDDGDGLGQIVDNGAMPEVWSLPITPKMRDAIKSEGQPLFMPSDHPEAITDAAIKMDHNGSIFKGRTHVVAMMQAEDRHPSIFHEHGPSFKEGFVTKTGQFLNRDQARNHAVRIGQITENANVGLRSDRGKLESTKFNEASRFMPKSQRMGDLSGVSTSPAGKGSESRSLSNFSPNATRDDAIYRAPGKTLDVSSDAQSLPKGWTLTQDGGLWIAKDQNGKLIAATGSRDGTLNAATYKAQDASLSIAKRHPGPLAGVRP